MKVVYIDCTHVDDSSIAGGDDVDARSNENSLSVTDSAVLGGAERYAMALAYHVSSFADTTLVSFSSSRRSIRHGDVKVELYPVKDFIDGRIQDPFSLRYLQAIAGSDIVHIHNLGAFVSDLSCVAGRLLDKKIVVTDHGVLGGRLQYLKLPVLKLYSKAVAYSYFGLRRLPAEIRNKAAVIAGGVDSSRFRPSASPVRESKILFVGRIVPEKGIRYLVEAFRLLKSSQFKLVIVGRVYDQKFYEEIMELSRGLPVTFIHDADDETLVNQYQTAAVTVLPSLFPELMGLALLESQACGTPVICSEAGAMHEFVVHGKTGLIVEGQSAEAIAEAIERTLSVSSTEAAKRQERCRRWAQEFDWKIVAKKHNELYRGLAGD